MDHRRLVQLKPLHMCRVQHVAQPKAHARLLTPVSQPTRPLTRSGQEVPAGTVRTLPRRHSAQRVESPPAAGVEFSSSIPALRRAYGSLIASACCSARNQTTKGPTYQPNVNADACDARNAWGDAPAAVACASGGSIDFPGERLWPNTMNPTVVAAMITNVQRSGPPNRLPLPLAGAG